MGCDLHGYVEVQTHGDEGHWYAAVCVEGVTGRSYDSFGCLFGVRNSAQFKPVADHRGLPDDLSLTAKVDHGECSDYHSESYLSFDEIQAIDWSEPARTNDSRISVVDAEGNTQLKGGYVAGIHETLSDDELARARDGDRIQLPDTDGDVRYATHKTLTRKEALSGAWWWLLHDQMDLLADRYGSEHVRIVVWFDN